MMGEGPTCTYNGVTIPSFVCISPKASITTELLVSMLATIDSYNVFSQNGPNDFPFLLLGGHPSCTMLPFLAYINNPEAKCFGVPYRHIFGNWLTQTK
jgi:hypothetical protein